MLEVSSEKGNGPCAARAVTAAECATLCRPCSLCPCHCSEGLAGHLTQSCCTTKGSFSAKNQLIPCAWNLHTPTKCS